MERDKLKIFIREQLTKVDLLHLTIFIKKRFPNLYQEVLEHTKYLKDCFFTERLFHITNDLTSIPKCTCEKNLKFYDFNRGYKEYCSLKCLTSSPKRNKKIKDVWQSRSESDIQEIIKKTKKTKLERYGDENFINSNKAKKTKLERYGDEKYCNKEQIKRSRLKSFYLSLFESERLKNLVIPLFDLKEYGGARGRKKYEFRCVKCNNTFYDTLDEGIIPRCLKCYPYLKGTSHLEKEIIDWLSKFINTKNKERFYYDGSKFYEIDVYIPEKRLGIELDGIYWHSEIGGNKSKNYHKDKTIFFEKFGIGIIHIFEDEWIEKKDIIKDIILSKLGLIKEKIYARNCEIKSLTNKECMDFLDQNHIQGYYPAKISLGLFHKKELVFLMSFGTPRYNKNFKWEILRLCSKINMNIIGAVGKILNYFKNNFPGSIITYVDGRFGDGSFYKKFEFTQYGNYQPSYFYLKNNKRFSRIKFKKSKLKDKLENFDPNLSEWGNMQLAGYDRIWDCGGKIFVKMT